MYSIRYFGLFYQELCFFLQLQYEYSHQDRSLVSTILRFEWLQKIGHMLGEILQINLRNVSFAQKMLNYKKITLLEAFIALI